MKKILKKLHLYIALIFFLPLILQGLTGAILIFHEELENFKSTKASQKPAEQPHEIAKIITAAQKFAPQELTPSFIKFEANGLDKVRFDKNFEVVINPETLEIIEQRNPETGFFYIVKKLHTNLLIKAPWSRNIIGIFGIALLFLTISGIILWWPKNLEKFRNSIHFKFSDIGYRFHKTMHKAIGFWFFITLTVISISGIYLSFKSPLRIKTSEISKEFLTIDEAEIIAKNSLARDAKLLSIAFPTKPQQPYRFNFASADAKATSPIISVFIDPHTAKIIEIRNLNHQSLLDQILAWQAPIHTGKAFGTFWRILLFLSAFTPIIFSITGIVMWRMKKIKKA